MVHAGLGLGDAEIHHMLAILGVHAHGPVLHAHPAFRAPTQQGLNLRADVGKLHRGPIDLPRNRLGRLQQGPVHGVVINGRACVGHAKSFFGQYVSRDVEKYVPPLPSGVNVTRNGIC
ncbi:hypothetical protein D3C81_1861940 [compost metagenome]